MHTCHAWGHSAARERLGVGTKGRGRQGCARLHGVQHPIALQHRDARRAARGHQVGVPRRGVLQVGQHRQRVRAPVCVLDTRDVIPPRYMLYQPRRLLAVITNHTLSSLPPQGCGAGAGRHTTGGCSHYCQWHATMQSLTARSDEVEVPSAGAPCARVQEQRLHAQGLDRPGGVGGARSTPAPRAPPRPWTSTPGRAVQPPAPARDALFVAGYPGG